MGFYQDYELLGLVHEGPAKTLRAREIATDRPVYLHLLTAALDAAAQESLLEKVQALVSTDPEVQKVGEFAGTRYVVTSILEPFTNLEQWVEQRAAVGVHATGGVGGGSSPEPASPTANSAFDTAEGAAGPEPPAPIGHRTELSVSEGLQELTEGFAAPDGSNAESDATSEVEEHLQQARDHLEDDALANALESLETALQLKPDNPEAQRLLDETLRMRAERESSQGSEQASSASDQSPLSEQIENPTLDLGATLASVDSRVEIEPELERRVEILTEALRLHPNEPHLQESLRLTQEKQQHVRSLAERAQSLEQEQQFETALNVWRQVQSAHHQFPGVDSKINELQRSAEEHRARLEAKTRWAGQVRRLLRAGDYEGAFDLARNALAECTGDAELSELAQTAGQGLQRADRLRGLLHEAQSLWKYGQRPEGLECLRKALEIDPKNALVRGELLSALVELAREQLETDWESAQSLVEEALRLEPNHTVAGRLLEQIAVRRREESISWSLVEARRLRSQGKLDEVQQLVSESLERYPGDDRLLQLKASLEGRGESPEDSASYDSGVFDTAERLDLWEAIGGDGDGTEAEAGTPTELSPESDLSTADPQEEDARALQPTFAHEDPWNEAGVPPSAAPSPESLGDGDLLDRLAIQSRAAAAQVSSQPPQQSSPRGAKDGKTVAAVWARVEPVLRGLRHSPVVVAAGKLPKSVLVGIAAAVLLVAIVALIWSAANSQPASPIAGGIPVSLSSSPAGATLSIDGEVCGVTDCRVDLTAGPHRVEAYLAGYHRTALSFEPMEGSAKPVVVSLLPLDPIFQVSSDLGSGEVMLDGKRIGELEDGTFEIELAGLAPGEHTLRVSSSGVAAMISFESSPGGAPRLTAPIRTSSVKAVVVAGLGSVAEITASETGAAIAVDGQPAGTAGDTAVSLGSLTSGTHQLSVGTGAGQTRADFDSSDAPVLAAFLNADRNVGALRVVTGEDDATIFLNNTPYRRKTARGRRVIYLVPKRYEIRVAKDGFRTPPMQVAEITKGGQVELKFELSPLPQTATLRIANGMPGTEVRIDGSSRGVIGAGGSFVLSNVEPGRRSIRLEKENYKPSETERVFEPGSTVEIGGVLESAVGTLAIEVSPPNVAVSLTLQSEGERPRRITNRTLQLAPGLYTVQASAPGFEDYSATVRVAVNETKTANLTLRKWETRPKVAVALADWSSAGWQREGDLLIRRGGDFSIAPGSGGAGRYTFTALLQRGRRLEWIVNYTDPSNYVFYQLGDEFFHRTEVSNGRRSRTIKIPHAMKWGDFLSIEINVEADSIAHRLLVGDNWTEVDNWVRPGGEFQQGKFGFHVSGRDQVGLSHFTFVPTPD